MCCFQGVKKRITHAVFALPTRKTRHSKSTSTIDASRNIFGPHVFHNTLSDSTNVDTPH